MLIYRAARGKTSDTRETPRVSNRKAAGANRDQVARMKESAATPRWTGEVVPDNGLIGTACAAQRHAAHRNTHLVQPGRRLARDPGLAARPRVGQPKLGDGLRRDLLRLLPRLREGSRGSKKAKRRLPAPGVGREGGMDGWMECRGGGGGGERTLAAASRRFRCFSIRTFSASLRASCLA